jgi:hypothetical protein
MRRFTSVDIKNEMELLEKQEAAAKRKQFESGIVKNNIWGHSPVGDEGKKAAMAMLSTKTGLYAKIPITCKTENCPYADSCALLPYGLAPYGEKCSWETALIETRYAGYMNDYNLDEASFTDLTTISELINVDVMLERSKALISSEGIAITDVVAGITESGEQFTRPEISKAMELYTRNLNLRDRLLDQMQGTRKAKKGSTDSNVSITDMLNSAINGSDFIIEERPEHFK